MDQPTPDAVTFDVPCERCGAPLIEYDLICPQCDLEQLEDEEGCELVEPGTKASTILYVTGAIFLFLGVMIPLGEIMARPGVRPDTIIEMFEWNPFSQIGLLGVLQGLFLFWLGVMTDRRGA